MLGRLVNAFVWAWHEAPSQLSGIEESELQSDQSGGAASGGNQLQRRQALNGGYQTAGIFIAHTPRAPRLGYTSKNVLNMII